MPARSHFTGEEPESQVSNFAGLPGSKEALPGVPGRWLDPDIPSQCHLWWLFPARDLAQEGCPLLSESPALAQHDAGPGMLVQSKGE